MNGTMTLPDGWESAPLGTVTDFIVDGSHNPPAKQATGLPMLSARNIHDGALSYEGRLISEADFLQEDRRTNVAPGDVLLTIVGTIGRAAVVPSGSPRFTLQRSVAVIKPGQLVPKFLMYQMQSSGFQQLLTTSARGTAQKGVYLGQLGDIAVKLAPLPEQRRIVAKIEELFSDLDAGVAALERVRIALKRYRASVLKAAVEGRLTGRWRDENPDVEPADELLKRILDERRKRWEQEQIAKYEAKRKKPPTGWREKYALPASPDSDQLPTLPPTWCWSTLEQLVVSGPQNGLYLPQSLYGNGVPILRIEDYQIGWSRAADELRRVIATPAEVALYSMATGDVVINRVNSPSHLGKALLVEGRNLPSVFESNMMRLRPAEPLNSTMIVQYLWSAPGRTRLTANAKWAVNQASINQGDVVSTPVPVPPRAEQDEIALQVGYALSMLDGIEPSLATVGRHSMSLRRTILARAFDGRLVPQDPTDEPASALLDRIKAERDIVQQITKPGRRSARQPASRKGYTLVPLPLDEME